MKNLSNKLVAILAFAPWASFLVIGFIKDYIGMDAPLPFFIESIVTLIGVVLTFYAFYRLFRAPDGTQNNADVS